MSSHQQNLNPEFLLWSTVVNDDEKAFEELFKLFYPSLSVYAKRYIENRAIREDIVQDVFVALWEGRKKLIVTSSIRNYLLLAVRNHCLNYLRKEGLNRQYQDFMAQKNSLSTDAQEAVLLSELYDLFEKALAKLPEIYRLVFEMHNMDGSNYEEIATALGISVRTAKRYKSQAVETLQKELKDYLPLLFIFYPQFIN